MITLLFPFAVIAAQLAAPQGAVPSPDVVPGTCFRYADDKEIEAFKKNEAAMPENRTIMSFVQAQLRPPEICRISSWSGAPGQGARIGCAAHSSLSRGVSMKVVFGRTDAYGRRDLPEVTRYYHMREDYVAKTKKTDFWFWFGKDMGIIARVDLTIIPDDVKSAEGKKLTGFYEWNTGKSG